jgi:hypothetical protein
MKVPPRLTIAVGRVQLTASEVTSAFRPSAATSLRARVSTPAERAVTVTQPGRRPVGKNRALFFSGFSS